MTIFYNDLSSYDAGFTVPVGTPAVVAKATEGIYYHDAQYMDFKAQAAKVGAAFSGYHFLKSESSPEAQAAYYHDFAGNVPCMLDVETEGGSRPGVDWCLRFMKALEGLGGRVWAVYYPHWYWNLTGGDLGSLERSGAVVVSSFYATYTDTGDGWIPYGGATPRIWQFKSVPQDTNAFKGTAEELAALINGASEMDLSTPLTFSPAVVQQFPELAALGFGGTTTVEVVLGWTAARTAHLVTLVNQLQNEVAGLQSGGTNPTAIADAVVAEIKAKL